jgi:glutathione synthase/RimK-type ligase-like ATP-grasp enzyme
MSVPDFRLAVASARQFPSIHEDDAHLAATLKSLGVEPVVCIWNDPAVDWAAFDAVLIRTIWDYFEHYAAFLAWTHTLDRLGVTVINDTSLMRWNSDKRYLLEMERRGVPIIPTRVASGDALPEALAAAATEEMVIKPTVSGGAWHTVRGKPGTAAFAQALQQLPRQMDYLLQPFVPEIASDGEWSLLYFEGAYSHAVLKRPVTGDYRVQEQHGGSITQATPTEHMLSAAGKVLATVAALGHQQPAYARVDGVVVGGRFLLMELEVIEPSLYLVRRPDAAERFARLLRQRLAQLPQQTRKLG